MNKIIRDPISNPDIVFKVLKKVVGIGKRIFERLFNGDDVKNEKPMDTKNGTTDEIMQISAILKDYREKVLEETGQLVDAMKDVCRDVFVQITESVEFANTEYKFYRVEYLRRKFEWYLSDIDSVFDTYVTKKISLDDADCVNVLKMLPGDLKGQRMAELKKSVFQNAINDLCGKLEEFQRDIIENMENAVEGKMISLENQIEERKKILEEMSVDSDQLQTIKEGVCMDAYYMSSVIDICNDIVESEG